MIVVTRPGQGMLMKMLLLAGLAYGGSFVVKGITAALSAAAARSPVVVVHRLVSR